MIRLTATEARRLGLRVKGGSKYKNVRVKTEEGTFDSKREYARWQELKLLERAGKITNLKRQIPYDLFVNRTVVGKIIIDFEYTNHNNEVVEEDVKSKPTITAVFRWKAKHFKAQYGRNICLIVSGAMDAKG